MPLFSIVIPVCNRERELKRILDSCFRQTCADFEILVVDDGSTDGSVGLAMGYSKVRVIQHAVQQGPNAAWNHGAQAAEGEWVVPVDTDQELLPEALALCVGHCARAPETLGRIGLISRDVQGRTSPIPSPDGGVMGYIGFLKWIDRAERWDALTLYRRRAWLAEPLQDARHRALLHTLDFAHRFDTQMLADLGAVDYGEVTRKEIPEPDECREHAIEAHLIVTRHAEALAKHAPGFLASQRRRAVVFQGLAGDTDAARRRAWELIGRGSMSMRNWMCLAAVFGGPKVLPRALEMKWWLAERLFKE